MSKTVQRISPFLWFDSQAEAAVNFYISIFENSRVLTTIRYGDSGPGPKGSIMTMEFQLAGQKFVALNGGPVFKFTEAISFVVNCDSQKEIDEYWKKLSAGGQEVQCGWLKDRYGLSWQIVPTVLPELLSRGATQAERVMAEVLKMIKIDIATLKKAADGG